MGIIERIFKYLADALGITPEEPPIIKELSEIVRAIKAEQRVGAVLPKAGETDEY